MKTILVVTFLIIINLNCLAQKEDYIWCMGSGHYKELWIGTEYEDNMGNTFIDFNEEPPLIYQDEDSHNQYSLGNGQIATPDGQPLLYCNGLEIRTFLNDTLDGGGVISHSQLWDDLVMYSSGIRLTTGTNVPQSIAIVPLPESEHKYILFYSFFKTPVATKQLLHAEIDMSLNNGAGKVIYKDSIVRPSIEDQMSFYLRPVRHANGRDWWILAPALFDEKIYRILIDPDGIHYMGVQEFHITSVGQAKFSPDGRYYGIADCNWIFSENNPENTVHLYEVDRCTGELVEVFNRGLFNCESVAGIEFSPDSKFMYYTNFKEVIQIDLTVNNIGTSVRKVWELEEQRDSIYFSNTPFQPMHMQLGPDKRIYVPMGGRGVISAINKPWLKGDACDFEDYAIITPTPSYPSTPNILNPRMGPVDGSLCDTLGIDNNPVAQFRYNQDDTLDYRTIGFVDLSYMEPTMWEWDFDDGGSSNEQYPVHSYAENGVYNVCLTVSNDNSSDTSCEVIQLGSVSTDNEISKPYVSIFPQPTRDFLRIAIHDYIAEYARLLVYDIKGQLVFQKRLLTSETTIDLSDIPSGIYTYQVWDRGSLITSDKLVKVE